MAVHHYNLVWFHMLKRLAAQAKDKFCACERQPRLRVVHLASIVVVSFFPDAYENDDITQAIA